MRYLKPYSYAWVTLGFFLISLVGHWLFGWFAFVNEHWRTANPFRPQPTRSR